MIPYARDIFAEATGRLKKVGVDNPAGDVGRLLEFAFGSERRHQGTLGCINGENDSLEWFWNALAERERRRPMSQIIGRRMFFGQNFLVNSAVLDPRPESEILVIEALARKPACILDIGTGSGCILLSILSELQNATGVGIDLHDNALDVARNNSMRLGLADRARFVRSDWLSEVTGKFDLVVANPPYVSESEYRRLAPEIRHWEPRDSITLGKDGLQGYRSIAGSVGQHLSVNAELLLEIGMGQCTRVSKIFREKGFVESGVSLDLDGRKRVLAFHDEQAGARKSCAMIDLDDGRLAGGMRN